MKSIILFFLVGSIFFSTPEVMNADGGEQAKGRTSGEGIMFIGEDPYDSNQTTPISGTIAFDVINNGDRGSSLQNIDEVKVDASFTSDFGEYQIIMKEPMLSDPDGKYPTWFGVGYDKKMHGNTNTRTNKLPKMEPNVAIYGWSQIYLNGDLIQNRIPTQIVASRNSYFNGVILEIGTEHMSIPHTPYHV